MPYIGNTIRAADDYRLIDDISSSFNGSTTSFALQVAGSAPVPFPKSPQQVLISVNGVIQEPDPTGSSGFNLVGTNIVFSSAPTNGHAFFGIIYATADYLNAGGNFPSGSLGAPSITFIGDENSGLYRKSGGSVGFVSDATEIANFDSNGITISSGNLILGDSSGSSDDRIKLGASGDLQLYHNGSNSFIVDNGTGNLYIRGDDTLFIQSASGEDKLKATTNGSVEIYHDNNKKFETVSNGVTVTGRIQFTDTNSIITRPTSSALSVETGGSERLRINSSGHVKLPDTKQLQFGGALNSGDGDLQIYHSGSHSYIQDSGTGALLVLSNQFAVQNAAGTETIMSMVENGSVDLYYDDSKKFETTSGGATLTGTLLPGANNTYSLGSSSASWAGIHFGDHAEVRIGNATGGDLKLFHNAQDSFIRNSTGVLKIQTGTENAITATLNGAVELYHDDSKKFETESSGCKITGSLELTANLVMSDDDKIRLGNSQDLEIYHDGTASRLHSGSHPFYIRSGGQFGVFKGDGTESMITATPDAAVDLYYDNSKKFETTSSGTAFSNGTAVFNGPSGTAYTAEIKPTNSNPYGLGVIENSGANAGYPLLAVTNNSGQTYFRTLSGGISEARDFRPVANNTYDLGTSSLRWANVYTNDLNLSNEGSSNDVDSTWGDYTIQEGFEDLFLINNRTGKKFKFNLTEVS